MGAEKDLDHSWSLFTGYGCRRLLGRSQVMQLMFEKIRQVASALATTILDGESGTGKELIARAIHAHSERHDRPFVAINCAGLNDTILESELFGHVKGAFSGADSDKPGLFEVADEGTLFLDEVAEMSLPLQAKLLRVLSTRDYRRVGDVVDRRVDMHVIAATNQNLHQLILEGRFRRDLFYRLNVVTIQVPPLRERMEDFDMLVDTFLRESAGKCKKPLLGMTPEARGLLRGYPWLGNVRELENCIDGLVVTTAGNTIDEQAVAIYFASQERARRRPFRQPGPLESRKRETTHASFIKHQGNIEATARDLSIHPSTLYRRFKRWGLDPHQTRKEVL
jgi:transcriptional regulator with PAS, ATPase and Fis domain